MIAGPGGRLQGNRRVMMNDGSGAGASGDAVRDAAGGDLWVFGYGSLMWRPGFAYAEAAVARLGGFHRSLCILSHVHRGTPECPGLVLGLDRGGSCVGRAFRVPAAERPQTVDYLRAREQATMVYRERLLRLRLGAGATVQALVYVADRAHGQYAGVLSADEQLRLIRQGRGISGPNGDYVLSTVAALEDLGIRDRRLHWLAGRLAETDAAAA